MQITLVLKGRTFANALIQLKSNYHKLASAHLLLVEIIWLPVLIAVGSGILSIGFKISVTLFNTVLKSIFK